ncbi:MAG: hypothetical protein GY816_06600, partial [Cytophagales bacterium]|nr:hypothetical protein [Cytophagales bacterium]
MGIVRQSLIGTALAYLGVIIGYINTLYVRPEFLDLSQVGIFNLVTANAMLIAPLCTAGMTGSVIKFFPQFKNAGTINQFFTFLVSVTIIVNSAVLLLGFVLKNVIVGLFEENAADYVQYLTITAIIIVCNSLFDLIYAFCKSLMKIIVPSFLRDIFLRVASIVLVGGYGLDYWSFDIAVQGLGFTYVISLTALLVYLLIKQGFRLSVPFNILDKGILRRIISFGGYSMLLAGSYAMINNIGYIQVSSLIGDEANGIFATCFIIGIIVEIPKRNMLKVLAPQFSKAMEDEDLSKVNRLYEKGSITLSVFGGLLFIGILTNINDLFIFIPQGERFTSGFWLIVFVCLAKLTGMVFSFSQEILVFSRYNIWALVYQITAVVVLVAINYLLIP